MMIKKIQVILSGLCLALPIANASALEIGEMAPNFELETEADFPLLSDEDKSVAKAYDVLSFMGFAKRHTIYIDKDGRVLKVDKNISPDTSAEDMINNLEALSIAHKK